MSSWPFPPIQLDALCRCSVLNRCHSFEETKHCKLNVQVCGQKYQENFFSIRYFTKSHPCELKALGKYYTTMNACEPFIFPPLGLVQTSNFKCAESNTYLSRFELKNAAFDLDVAFHMCRIEFVSTGNTAMDIIKLIFFFVPMASLYQDTVGMDTEDDGAIWIERLMLCLSL